MGTWVHGYLRHLQHYFDCVRQRASCSSLTSCARTWARTFSIRTNEACKTLTVHTRSHKSLAQIHLALDVVGGWRRTPNEGMARCRWICPEIVGPESPRPASGEATGKGLSPYLGLTSQQPAHWSEAIKWQVRHRHDLACVHVQKSLCGPQMQRPSCPVMPMFPTTPVP